jgi:hypothetical protein
MDDASYLIDWLSARDAQCPLCQYNLRGLTRPVCPECGNHLRLTVSLVDPYLKAWIALVVALLLPAGVGLIWVFVVAKVGMPRGTEAGMFLPVLYQIASVPLAILAVATRRRVQRWSRNAQRVVAATACLACVVSFMALFSAMMR